MFAEMVNTWTAADAKAAGFNTLREAKDYARLRDETNNGGDE